jgi:hypothetical protein
LQLVVDLTSAYNTNELEPVCTDVVLEQSRPFSEVLGSLICSGVLKMVISGSNANSLSRISQLRRLAYKVIIHTQLVAYVETFVCRLIHILKTRAV